MRPHLNWRHLAIILAVGIAIPVAVILRDRGRGSGQGSAAVGEVQSRLQIYRSQVDSAKRQVTDLSMTLDLLRRAIDQSTPASAEILSLSQQALHDLEAFARIRRLLRDAGGTRPAIGDTGGPVLEPGASPPDLDSIESQLVSLLAEIRSKRLKLQRALTRVKGGEYGSGFAYLVVGRLDSLRARGWLKEEGWLYWRKARLSGFPSIVQPDGKLMLVPLGSPFSIGCSVDELVDYSGPLSKGHQYEILGHREGYTRISILDTTLHGRRLLAIEE